MVCIYCGGNTQVTNSRLQRRVNQVWRRRSCAVCGNIFTTHERPDLSTAIAVRYTDKDVRHFSRDTLLISLYESCKHRPHAIQDAEALSQTVTSLLLGLMDHGSISREDIVVTCTQVLERFDKTAATVYTAFHKL